MGKFDWKIWELTLIIGFSISLSALIIIFLFFSTQKITIEENYSAICMENCSNNTISFGYIGNNRCYTTNLPINNSKYNFTINGMPIPFCGDLA